MMRCDGDPILAKASKSLPGRAARSQNYRSAVASADSFDRYGDTIVSCTIVLTLV